VFGPEDEFFNRFANLARFSPVLPLIGGGETRFQPVFVGDVAEAIARRSTAVARGARLRARRPGGEDLPRMPEEMLEVIDRKRMLVPVPWWPRPASGEVSAAPAEADADRRPGGAAAFR
jgi:uncharacterized protein YbjT (DUF2867 family)